MIICFFSDPNNQATIPMSMPFSSPPPRYVSVFGLSEVNNSPKKRRNRSSHDQNSRIQELCGSNKNKKTKPVINPKINPVQIADEDEILEDEIDSNSGMYLCKLLHFNCIFKISFLFRIAYL